MSAIIKAKPVMIGNPLRVLTHAAKDRDGKVWPAGTELSLGSAGCDNLSDSETQIVEIKGKRVVFERKARP